MGSATLVIWISVLFAITAIITNQGFVSLALQNAITALLPLSATTAIPRTIWLQVLACSAVYRFLIVDYALLLLNVNFAMMDTS